MEKFFLMLMMTLQISDTLSIEPLSSLPRPNPTTPSDEASINFHGVRSTTRVMTATEPEGTTVNLQNAKAEAEAEKEAAEQALEEAEASKAAAEDASTTSSEVNSKINELTGASSTPANTINGRKKRNARDTATTASYETPTSCAAFIEMVGDMTSALQDEKYSKATKIGTALVSVDSDSVSCSSSEISSLEAQQTTLSAAQDDLTTTIAELEDEITATTEKITELEATIAELAAAIKSDTTIDARKTSFQTNPIDSTLLLSTEGSAGECCRVKRVGSSTYRLTATTGAGWQMEGTDCKNTCIYQMEGPGVDPEFRFCFKTGVNPVSCIVGN